MTDLYLIAHKVRSEPAFDIAERMACPECSRQVPDLISPEVVYTATKMDGCADCDDEGFWWIVSTSGHRAYPYASIELSLLGITTASGLSINEAIGEMPPSLPDHYPTRQAKPEKSSGKSLLAALGLLPKVHRRL